MKFSLSALAAAALIVAAPWAAAQNVAIVNGKAVPTARIEMLAKQAEASGRPVDEATRAQLKEEVILREIFMQEAQKRGIPATEDYKIQMELARQTIMIRAMFQDYQAKNPVTDAEVKAEYDKFVASNGGKEYRARHILVEKEDEAKAIIASLKGGAKFEDIAKKQSKDPGSGANGGDLDWANAASYVTEFSEAMIKLEKGQMTQEPVKSQFGWHIIRVDDVRQAAVAQARRDQGPDLPADAAAENGHVPEQPARKSQGGVISGAWRLKLLPKKARSVRAFFRLHAGFRIPTRCSRSPRHIGPPAPCCELGSMQAKGPPARPQLQCQESHVQAKHHQSATASASSRHCRPPAPGWTGLGPRRSLPESAKATFSATRLGRPGERAQRHLLFGVPLHWMTDWGTPFALHVDHASGAQVTDVDGHTLVDFCLGDTGAMLGHAPAPVAAALQAQATRGYTTMLATEDASVVGEALAERFGLPYWQFAMSATDANRYIVRWIRAATGRKKLLVFNGCYHGTIEDVFVDIVDGRPVQRGSLLGQVHDLTEHTVVVEFNDLAALEAALAPGDVACVLAEPVMTNIGMVMPEPGFWEAAQRLIRQHGALAGRR